MRWLAATLGVLALPLVVLAQDEKVKLAKLYLTGDRIIEGELVAEDEATITVKTETAEAAFGKAEVVHVVRSELTRAELAEKRKARSVYTSLLLGYKITKPDDWHWKLDPPEPLSDVLARQHKELMDVSIFGLPDSQPDLAFDEKLLEALAKTSETKLKEKFTAVRRSSAEKKEWKKRPAFFLEFSLRKKDTQKDYRLAEAIFRHEGKIVFASVWAPSPRFDKARTAFEGMLATFEAVKPNAQEGDRLFNTEFLFAVEKPAGWKFQKNESGEKARVEAVSPKGDARLEVEVVKLDPTLSLDAWTKTLDEGAAGLKSPKKLPGASANVGGRYAVSWIHEHGDESARRRRSVYLMKDLDRGYRITTEFPAKVLADQLLLTEALSKFRILNSLLAPGALERGLKAIERFDEGDRALEKNAAAEAAQHYEEALLQWPRYAACLNNLGIAYLRSRESEKARRALEKAYDMFPEDPTVRGNFALGLCDEAASIVKDPKRLDEASRLADRARGMIPAEGGEAHREELALVYNALGIGYAEKDLNDKAAGHLEKALALKPKDDAQIKRNHGIICVNAAVQAYNKKNDSSAVSWAKRALKHDPQNAKAKEIVDLVQKNKKK